MAKRDIPTNREAQTPKQGELIINSCSKLESVIIHYIDNIHNVQLQSVGPAAYRECGSSCSQSACGFRSAAERGFTESAGPATTTESAVPSAESVGPAARGI